MKISFKDISRFKITIAIIILAVLLLAAGVLIFQKVRFKNNSNNTQPLIISDDSQKSLPDQDFGTRDPKLSNEQNLIKDYISAHLSDLSPTKEVLGGKFYITDIEFPLSNQAIISYEDGHIALQAEVNYTLNEKELKISSFKIIKEN